MTPNTVYDFAHPIMGQSHVKMFREEAQRTVDYIEYQIRGRLVKARNRHNERGMWAGRKILPGFMMDNRPQLSNGATNPDYRKYKRFEPYADVVKRYFEIFRELSGNFTATWLKIDKEGPYFPDLPERPHQRLSTSWGTEVKHYKYQLFDYPYRTNVWNIKASIVDGLVNQHLTSQLCPASCLIHSSLLSPIKQRLLEDFSLR